MRAWEARTGRPLGALPADTAVYALAFEPGTHRLAAGCVGPVRVWDLDHHPGFLTWDIPGGTDRASVAVSDVAGAAAWAGSSDGAIVVAPLSRSREPVTLRAHESAVKALAFDEVGRLASAGGDGRLLVWDVRAARVAGGWETGDGPARALLFTRDGRLVSGTDGGSVQLWRGTGGDSERSWPAREGAVLAMALSPDGTRLATGGADWRVAVWDLGSGDLVDEWRHGEWVNALAWDSAGERQATGGADLTIRITRPGSAEGRAKGGFSPGAQRHGHWVNALVFLDGDRVLLSGGNDGALRFWDTGTGEELAALPCARGAIHDLAVTSDERWVLVGAHEGVQLLDLGFAAERIAMARR